MTDYVTESRWQVLRAGTWALVARRGLARSGHVASHRRVPGLVRPGARPPGAARRGMRHGARHARSSVAYTVARQAIRAQVWQTQAAIESRITLLLICFRNHCEFDFSRVTGHVRSRAIRSWFCAPLCGCLQYQPRRAERPARDDNSLRAVAERTVVRPRGTQQNRPGTWSMGAASRTHCRVRQAPRCTRATVGRARPRDTLRQREVTATAQRTRRTARRSPKRLYLTSLNALSRP